jgi:hypothetical protein
MNRIVLLAFVLSPLLGCAPPETIRTYKAKREGEAVTPAPAPVGPKAYRIIGAALASQNPEDANTQVWYIKAGGRADTITESEKAIDEFIASLKLGDDPQTQPSWKLPEGWSEVPKRMMTLAVFRFGPPERTCELTISRVGGGLASNLKRWGIDQLKMPAQEFADGKAFLKPLKVGEVSGYRIDMSGPNDPATKSGGMMMGGK